MMHNISFIIDKLYEFWSVYNIRKIPSYHMPVGAATYHPFCIVSALNSEPLNIMYTNTCVRHDDGTGFDEHNTAFHRNIQHFQFQVLWKKCPIDILEIYKKSLEFIGFDFTKHALKIISSQWQTTSLGAFGYGYEIYINDLEITQFTYFESICDIKVNGPFVEIAYGIERLAIALNNAPIYNIDWCDGIPYTLLRFKEEQHLTQRNAILPIINQLHNILNDVQVLMDNKLYVAALQEWLKANDHFNALIARNMLLHEERETNITKLRKYANQIGVCYVQDLTSYRNTTK